MKSIKAKLLLLGAVSIICTIILCDTIAENLNIMQNTAKDALSYSCMKDYKSSPESISSDIDKALGYTAELKEMLEKRGFQSGTGMYDSFAKYDEDLEYYLSYINAETEWLDGAWGSIDLADGDYVTVDSVGYRKD